MSVAVRADGCGALACARQSTPYKGEEQHRMRFCCQTVRGAVIKPYAVLLSNRMRWCYQTACGGEAIAYYNTNKVLGLIKLSGSFGFHQKIDASPYFIRKIPTPEIYFTSFR